MRTARRLNTPSDMRLTVCGLVSRFGLAVWVVEADLGVAVVGGGLGCEGQQRVVSEGAEWQFNARYRAHLH